RGDMQHFRRITCEGGTNAVVMGRKTWQSAEVGGKPLPGRTNIVITRGALDVPAGVIVARSLDAALEVAAPAMFVVGGDVAREASATFVVGGAEIFREAFAHAALRYVYLTRIEGRFGCDVKIPDLDALGFS